MLMHRILAVLLWVLAAAFAAFAICAVWIIDAQSGDGERLGDPAVLLERGRFVGARALPGAMAGPAMLAISRAIDRLPATGRRRTAWLAS